MRPELHGRVPGPGAERDGGAGTGGGGGRHHQLRQHHAGHHHQADAAQAALVLPVRVRPLPRCQVGDKKQVHARIYLLCVRGDGVKHSVQCSQCGSARPVDTDTWSLEEPCEECEHGEDSAQVNSRTTFCQHSVNMNNKPVCAGGAVGAVPRAGEPGGGAGLRPGGAQLQLPPHLGGSRARRGAALDIYVCRDLLYYNIWAQ